MSMTEEEKERLVNEAVLKAIEKMKEEKMLGALSNLNNHLRNTHNK